MKLSTLQLDDFNAVYDAYGDILYRLAMSHVRCDADAQDVVQDVFISYLRAEQKFRSEEHRKAWLLRVTVNKCRDLLRRRSVRESVPLDELFGIGEEDRYESEVLRVVLDLPEKLRTPMILHYFEDIPVSDIAKALMVTSSAVKMRLSRGRERLKQVLQEDTDGKI